MRLAFYAPIASLLATKALGFSFIVPTRHQTSAGRHGHRPSGMHRDGSLLFLADVPLEAPGIIFQPTKEQESEAPCADRVYEERKDAEAETPAWSFPSTLLSLVNLVLALALFAAMQLGGTKPVAIQEVEKSHITEIEQQRNEQSSQETMTYMTDQSAGFFFY